MLVFSHLHVDDTVIGSHALDRRTIGGVFALAKTWTPVIIRVPTTLWSN